MPLHDFTVPTYDMKYENELGRFGLSWPASYTVIINTSDVATTFPGAVGLVDPDDIYDVARSGNGEKGKAVYRFGLTYQLSTTEADILTLAGYTVS